MNNEEITVQDLRNCGFESIQDAWDSYCVYNNTIQYRTSQKPFITNAFVSYVKQMAAGICSDCCDDSGFGDDNGEW